MSLFFTILVYVATVVTLFTPVSLVSAKGKAAAKRGRLVIHGTGDVNLDWRTLGNLRRFGYEYAFSGVSHLFRNDDLTVINLECSVSERGERTPWKRFNFRAEPRSLTALKSAGIEVANLANNHSQDYGLQAMFDTRQHLLSYGIQPVGVGRNLAEATRPARFRIKGWKVAVLGFGGVVPSRSWLAGPDHPGMASGNDIPTMVAAVKAAKKWADIVVVSIHWGRERDLQPEPGDIRRARAMIDAGADIIFGHHPHRLQPVTIYKGRPIFWSLGNFVWPRGSIGSASTGIARVEISPRGEFRASLIPAYIASSSRPALVSPPPVLPVPRRGEGIGKAPRSRISKRASGEVPSVGRGAEILFRGQSARIFRRFRDNPRLWKDCLRGRVGRRARNIRRLCGKWRSELQRDTLHFHLFYPYIVGKGGGFVGLGGPADFTLAAWARAESAWFVADNPFLLGVMLLKRTFLLHSRDRRSYLRWWRKGRWARRAVKVLEASFADPLLREFLVACYRHLRPFVWWEYRSLKRKRWEMRRRQRSMRYIRREMHRYQRPAMGGKALSRRRFFRRAHWLDSEGDFRWLRRLAFQGRLRIVPDELVNGLGESARQASSLRVKIALFHREERDSFMPYSLGLLKALRGLPWSDGGWVLRTYRGHRLHYERRRPGRALAIVQQWSHWRSRMGHQRFRTLHQLMYESRWVPSGLFVISRPSPLLLSQIVDN